MAKIGFVNGCYDLFHEGHQSMLRECIRNCDHLVIAMNSDRYCRKKKGKNRPLWPWEKRFDVITDWHAAEIMDADCLLATIAIIPFEGDDMGLLMHIRPDILFKGYDHNPGGVFYRRIGWKKARPGEKIMEGPEIYHCSHVPGVSTTILAESR